MNPCHILNTSPTTFAKAAAQIIASRDISLRLRGVSYQGGRLAAIIDELPASRHATGSLLEVAVAEVKDPTKHAAALAEKNPCWSVLAVFPSRDIVKKTTGEAKSKSVATVIVVAVLSQP